MDSPVSKTSMSSPMSTTSVALNQETRAFDDKDLDVAAYLTVDADATGKPIDPQEAARIK